MQPGEEAGSALFNFLNTLAGAAQEDTADLIRYADAVKYYGGSWTELEQLNAGYEVQNRAALLKRACLYNGYVCLPLEKITSGEERDGYHFWAVYRNRDGTPFTLGGKSQFEFRVQKNTAGQWQVMNLPPRGE